MSNALVLSEKRFFQSVIYPSSKLNVHKKFKENKKFQGGGSVENLLLYQTRLFKKVKCILNEDVTWITPLLYRQYSYEQHQVEISK